MRFAVIAGGMAVAVEVGGLASAALAQDAGRRVPCAGQTITAIEVRTSPPFEQDGEPWYRAPLRLANSIHTTTSPGVVRRFLLMHEGEPCEERKRRESERLLRGYSFLASAEIRVLDDGANGVRLLVLTTDELTAVLDGTMQGSRPTRVVLGDRNVGGRAIELVAHWRDGDIRDGWGIAATHHQLAGMPYELDLLLERGDVGERRWIAGLSHPFLIDEQRRAWRLTALESDQVFVFRRPGDLAPVELGVSRKYLDVAAVVRVGPPGRLSLFGVSFTRELNTSMLPPTVDTTGQSALLLPRFSRRSNARVNALWGVRSLSFLQARRMDALTANQDLARGFQLGVIFGRSLSALAAGDDDMLLAGDLYAGAGDDQTFVRLSARGEGRQNYDADRWDGILTSAELEGIQLLGRSHTLEMNLEWSGGWRSRVPFQLTFADPRGGVRGYHDQPQAGAQRVVARMEDRFLVDTWRRDADVAGSVFIDAGRLWAGDVPYGVDTPVRVGAGIGLLAAIPAGSRRTYRLELAFPLSTQAGSGWELRLTTTSIALPIGFREPDDVARSRERSVPRSVF